MKREGRSQPPFQVMQRLCMWVSGAFHDHAAELEKVGIPEGCQQFKIVKALLRRPLCVVSSFVVCGLLLMGLRLLRVH